MADPVDPADLADLADLADPVDPVDRPLFHHGDIPFPVAAMPQ